MKTLLLSDIHVDMQFAYAVEPERLKCDDPDESVVTDTLEYMWKFYNIPETEGIIIPGDFSNDFLTFSRTIPWLSNRYKSVMLVAGNHDAVVRGSTPSKSNLQFTSTEQKFAHMKDVCRKYDNVVFLDEEERHTLISKGIGGCMGFCDFKCEAPTYGMDAFTAWKRNWFDGKYMRYFNQEPGKIWNHYEKALTDILAHGPKVVVTHFVPYELGVPFDFRNDPWNYVFYFMGEKFLDMMENDTYWFCGHVHGRRMADYVNSKGNMIHIRCNPLAYPGERSNYCDIVDYTGETIKRSSKPVTDSDFIFDL